MAASNIIDRTWNSAPQSDGKVHTALASDTTPPSTPGTPVAVLQQGGGVATSWLPSTDARGLSNYQIKKNTNVPIIQAALRQTFDSNGNPAVESNAQYVDPNGLVGDSYQVSCSDIFGNTSPFSAAAVVSGGGGGGGGGTFIVAEDWSSGSINPSIWSQSPNWGSTPPERRILTKANQYGSPNSLYGHVETAYTNHSERTEIAPIPGDFFGVPSWMALAIRPIGWADEYANNAVPNTYFAPWDILLQGHGREYYVYTDPNTGKITNRGLNPPMNLSLRTNNDGTKQWVFQVIGDTRSVAAITNNGTSSPSYQRGATYNLGLYQSDKWQIFIFNWMSSTPANPAAGFWKVWFWQPGMTAASPPTASDSGVNSFPNTTDDSTGQIVKSNYFKMLIYKGWTHLKSDPTGTITLAPGAPSSRTLQIGPFYWGRTSDGNTWDTVNPVTYWGAPP